MWQSAPSGKRRSPRGLDRSCSSAASAPIPKIKEPYDGPRRYRRGAAHGHPVGLVHAPTTHGIKEIVIALLQLAHRIDPAGYAYRKSLPRALNWARSSFLVFSHSLIAVRRSSVGRSRNILRCAIHSKRFGLGNHGQSRMIAAASAAEKIL